MIALDRGPGRRLVDARVGPALGLLFLIGPLADLADEPGPAARTAAIALVLVAFAALYLALLPPTRRLAARGPRAILGAVALLAALAGLTLALGAPGSFAVLFVYVAVAAGFALPLAEAAVAVVATAVGVGVGLAASGSDGSAVAAYALSILGLGSTMAALGSATRTNRELRAARDDLARLAVSEERLRFARDLHDLLGHTLTLIALKSDLAMQLVDN